MKVREIMTSRPRVCSPSDLLSEAAAAMWENDCGVLPVVDEEGRAVGMITDRDICMATTFKGSSPTELHVSDIGYRAPYSCHPDDPVAEAINIMRDAQVHRIPVVDDDNRVQGILSTNDVILEAPARRGRRGSDTPMQ